MEVKKSKKADLEGQKSTSLLIGLVISLAVTFVAFEWTTHEYKEKAQTFLKASSAIDETDMVPITQPIFNTTPLVEENTPQVAEILNIVDEDIKETKIETTEDLNTAVQGPTASSVHFSMFAPPAPRKEETDEDEIFEYTDEEPQFPGGTSALMAWLNKNIKYPSSAQESCAQGRVLVTFVVNKDGTIVEPRITHSVDHALDKESIRVVSAMPRWKPGKQHGKPVRVKFTLPVTFRLQ